MSPKTAQELKEEGNTAYKEGNWEEALSKYTEAIKISEDSKEKLVFYKNRAAVYLKTESYNDVVKDCSQVLDETPNDPKALFRRAQAYEALEQQEKAYQDARAVQNLDPKNKEVQAMLARLHKIMQEKIQEHSRTSGKVEQMIEILFDVSQEKEKRETSANNLIALVKERAGAELVVEKGVIGRVAQLLKTEKNKEIRLSCTRALSELCKNPLKVKPVMQAIGLPWLIDLMNSTDASQVNATQYTFQTIINTLAGMDMKNEKKPDAFLLEENKKEIDSTMVVLTKAITSRSMSGICRDAVVELLLKNIDYKCLNWAEKFIRAEGMTKLLELASELEEYHYESSMDTSPNTRMTTAICLSKVYECCYDEKARTRYLEMVEDHLRDMLLSPEVEMKVRSAVTITTLLMGPTDVGNAIIGKEGTLEMLLVMANTEDVLQQKVACEALIVAANKKDKCKAIMTQGTDILKRLYQSKNDSIKVRALVGLCKLGSLGGTDASMKPFAEGASLKLAEACRRFLINPTKDKDMRRWACEGLSYLTLDADVKEKLIEDLPALRSMLELAKSGDMNCLYGVVTTLVNLTNAYDKQEILPEMVELAKFAKQHIPEEHDLDDKDFVDKRVRILAEEGVGAALVALSKTESANSRELIGRIFNAICEMQDNRGLIVQQGGTKALLSLSMEGTTKGKHCAAQALARIAITMDPQVAFPGQRSYEVVRPLLKLLNIECSGLENFEALMALCNIAGVSESARQRILKEKGLALIEHYTFEHHEMIRRAAIQTMVNMCLSPTVVSLMEGDNDKFKYMFLCTSDEDEEIVKAAGGAVCMLLSNSEKCRKKVFDALDWQEILQFLLSHANPDIQYRGTVIVYLLMTIDKYTAEKIIDTHCKDALEAIAKIDNPEVVLPQAKEYAYKCLKEAAKWKFIKDPDATDD
ncbi:unc-45 myosin chaperone [Oratosquilla oratoria]|uniref:unc-45 myosin chaperone n=1 Tax=Oratosquilla oratoria TaxID=337810 RepID=UPI003F76F580